MFLAKQAGPDAIITPIYPPEDGHKAQNYKGFFNPMHDSRVNGSTIKDQLRRGKLFLRRDKFYNHMSAQEVKDRVPSDVWHDYFKFSVERNPWGKGHLPVSYDAEDPPKGYNSTNA